MQSPTERPTVQPYTRGASAERIRASQGHDLEVVPQLSSSNWQDLEHWLVCTSESDVLNEIPQGVEETVATYQMDLIPKSVGSGQADVGKPRRRPG
ncbi:hypothetical protein FA13DRAFT_1724085, partial [Coprinellus micaceus]